MGPDEFRQEGKRLIDWIADYWERIESFPVRPPIQPGEIASRLPAQAPERPESWDAIFSDLERIVLPGVTHWQSPNFFAFFPANASGPAVLGELLSAGLGVQGMLWSTSPACTEIETRMLDWLADLIGLPEAFKSTAPNGGGVIQGTASEATLVAMVAARTAAERRGAAGEFVAYCSTQAHSSVLKDAAIAGFGRENVRQIDVDESLAMDPAALRKALEADRAAGRIPTFVCATVGTTSTTAVDPVAEIAAAIDETIWLHVDAAYAGAACVCPEHRWMLAGVDRADSFNFNPHKWLLTNFDCSAFWTRRRSELVDALSITPEYLRNAASESGEVIDYRDWQIPLGRRFRALKLWFVLRRFGAEGLRAYIREHIRLAESFERWIREDDRFEIAAPRTLSLVCFRLRASDEMNRALLERLNAGGRVFLTHTLAPVDEGEVRRERVVLRMAIGAARTEERHVAAAWDLIRQEAAALLDSA